MQKLINTTQASEWMEGYPLGNGRLASMLWGNDASDILTLNEEWLWRGVHRNKNIADASGHLAHVRELFLSGELRKATAEAVAHFGNENTNVKIDAYQVAGDIVFTYDSPQNITCRELDIENGVAFVKRQDVQLVTYVDCVKDIAVAMWKSENTFSGCLEFKRCADKDAVEAYRFDDNKILYTCRFNGGITFSTVLKYFTDGKTENTEQGVKISDATYIELTADICADKYGKGLDIPDKKYNFDCDISEHKKVFSSYMNRVQLNLCDDQKHSTSIAERIANLRNGKKDISIASLYFDYGRYLMVSCSILAELPANLQGKWNDSVTPPWSSDYHLDINLQMNYWMCEAVGFGDFTKPLVSYLLRLMESGRKSAKLLYGCKGTLLPLSDDAWGEALPVSRVYGIWTGAAPWLAQHLWWHYIYTGDRDFLKTDAYPFFRAVAEFYEDYLIKDQKGIYQFIPSQSPENRYEGVTDFDVSLCISSAMDVQLCYDALGYAISSAEILGTDADKADLWKGIRQKLPPFGIGSDGRLLEWNEEKLETEPGHRHVSHLYGVYPSDLFLQKGNEPQYAAAEKSLEYRLSHGGGHTGWSRAWIACLYARFGKGEKFLEHLYGLAKDFATDSLLDLHPPRIFQIDGNFGIVSAVVEALVSYTDGKVHLLRALPDEWKKGSLCGIRLPGGHIIDVHWENGTPVRVQIKAGFENKLTLVANGKEKEIRGNEGEIINITF